MCLGKNSQSEIIALNKSDAHKYILKTSYSLLSTIELNYNTVVMTFNCQKRPYTPNLT